MVNVGESKSAKFNPHKGNVIPLFSYMPCKPWDFPCVVDHYTAKKLSKKNSKWVSRCNHNDPLYWVNCSRIVE